jgi:hypothetical protein
MSHLLSDQNIAKSHKEKTTLKYAMSAGIPPTDSSAFLVVWIDSPKLDFTVLLWGSVWRPRTAVGLRFGVIMRE